MAQADIRTARQPLKAGYKMISCRQGGPFSRQVYLEIPETLEINYQRVSILYPMR